jgi:hypothetical protein
MKTMSMHAREITRWRWVATALAVIFMQAAVAVVVKSDGRQAQTTATETTNGRE